MPMKPFWSSLTFWGAFVAFFPTLLSVFGFSLSEAEVASLPLHWDTLMQAIGFFGAIFGRVRAKTGISLT